MWLQSYIVVQGYFNEHNSHSTSHITMWYSIFVKVIDNLHHVLHSSKSANDVLEEGDNDVKSAWPLWVGLHTCYNAKYNKKQEFKAEQI